MLLKEISFMSVCQNINPSSMINPPELLLYIFVLLL